MSYKINLILAGMIFLLINIASATTMNINPVQETFISSGINIPVPNNDLLISNADKLDTFTLPKKLISNVLLKFDLTKVPKDASINSAILTMYVNNSINSGNIAVSLLSNNDWDKSSTTIPQGTTTLLSSQLISTTGKVSWDVKQGTSSGIITFLLEEPKTDNLIARFASSVSTSDKIPVLIIDYTETIPQLTITVPASVTKETTGAKTIVDIGKATTTGGKPPISIANDAPVDGFPVGKTTVTWTATDSIGAIAKGKQLITITKSQEPKPTVVTAVRTISMIGKEATVTVTLKNDGTGRALSLGEMIPQGLTLTKISDDADQFKSSTNEWVWFAIEANAIKTVKYKLTISDVSKIYNVDGSITTKGIVTSVTGDHIVSVIKGDILAYYRGLGMFHDIVETSDLLKAADNWRKNIIPPGFSRSITTIELMKLADEWRNS